MKAVINCIQIQAAYQQVSSDLGSVACFCRYANFLPLLQLSSDDDQNFESILLSVRAIYH